MGVQSSSADDELPRGDNFFEPARLGVFATPGSPQAHGMPDLQLRNPGSKQKIGRLLRPGRAYSQGPAQAYGDHFEHENKTSPKAR
jgi:hypothetical protein